MTDLAVRRDRAEEGVPVSDADDLSVSPDRSGQPRSTVAYSDALTKAIPTESLTAYVALIAVFSSVSEGGGNYLPARWWVFGGFMALTLAAVIVLYRRKSTLPVQQRSGNAGASRATDPVTRRPFPTLELAMTMLAAAAWGLVLPGGPLTVLLTGNAETLTVSSIIIGAGAIVALAGGPLTRGAPDRKAP